MNIRASLKYKVVIGLELCFIIFGLSFFAWKIIDSRLSKHKPANTIMASDKLQNEHTDSANIQNSVKVVADTHNRGISRSQYKTEIPLSDRKGESAESTAVGNEAKKPLTREEELRERLRLIDQNPEFKALNDRRNQLLDEHDRAGVPVSLVLEQIAYVENEYSVLGYKTFKEGERAMLKGELTMEQIDYMKKVGEDLSQRIRSYMPRLKALEAESNRIYQRMLNMLNMTEEEFSIACGRPYNPPNRVEFEKVDMSRYVDHK